MKNWVKIIALWHLFCAGINLSLILLVRLSIIEQSLRLTDYAITTVNIFGNFIIFLGLQRFDPRGWKLAVLFIPLSWAYYTHELVIGYRYAIGLIIAPFIFTDCFILRFLFKEPVTDLFRISSPGWIRLRWLSGPLFIFAVLLLIRGLVNDMIATVLAVAILLCLHWAYKKRGSPHYFWQTWR